MAGVGGSGRSTSLKLTDPLVARATAEIGHCGNAQVPTLRKHGVGKVFREAANGAKTKWVQLRRVLDQLDAGDVLLVTRRDRLARSHSRPVEHPRGDPPTRKPASTATDDSPLGPVGCLAGAGSDSRTGSKTDAR